MATLRDIRRRISSVRSTQQITKAMKMVAAAKLRKAQARLINARPYAYRLGQLLSHVAAKEDRSLHPLLAVREPNNICIVTVTADRGLCGSFNTNIIRRAKSEFDAQISTEKVSLVTVGKKGFEHFSHRGYDIIERYTNFFDELEFKHALNISSLIQDMYQTKELDRVFVVYNEFKSAALQRVIVEQLLPIEPQLPEFDKYQPVDYLYEPSASRILDEICPKNLNIQIWRILLESYAAEQGARMIAMETATDNAQEMIYDLTLYYNKVRQATITKEITEIVGGAEALRT
ncbi:MAG: ATP synthase F1 subunit gamma [bacterium]